MFLRYIMILAALLVLVSCSTMKKSNTEQEEADRKIKTAKINAQLGIAYLERHNIHRAKQKLLLALQQAPNIPESWYSMGYFLEATGEKAQAKEHYLKAIEVAPKRGDAHNNYGTFLCRAGNYQAAILEFKLAVNDPDYLDSAGAYENAGICSLKIPDKKQANHYFKQALLQDPNRPVSLIKLADLNYERGNFKAAKVKLDQYLAIAPATQQSLLLTAQLERRLGEEKNMIQVEDQPVHIAALKKEVLSPQKQTIKNDFNQKSPSKQILSAQHVQELRDKFLKPGKPKIIVPTPAVVQKNPTPAKIVEAKIEPKVAAKNSKPQVKMVAPIIASQHNTVTKKIAEPLKKNSQFVPKVLPYKPDKKLLAAAKKQIALIKNEKKVVVQPNKKTVVVIATHKKVANKTVITSDNITRALATRSKFYIKHGKNVQAKKAVKVNKKLAKTNPKTTKNKIV